MLGWRVFQMDVQGSVYVNENKQGGCWGGGDGHEGVNWEFHPAENPSRDSSPLHLSLKLFNQWLPLKYEDCGGGVDPDASHKLPENGIGGAVLSPHLI